MSTVTLVVPEGTEILSHQPLSLRLPEYNGLTPSFTVAAELVPVEYDMDAWLNAALARMMGELDDFTLLSDEPCQFLEGPGRRTTTSHDLLGLAMTTTAWWSLGHGVGIVAAGMTRTADFDEVLADFEILAETAVQV